MTPDEDPLLLRQIQLATTYVLSELDRVCTTLGISYAAYGGTAIGAVRHQGFIPWDDDADVCMTRGEYQRFLEEAPAALGEDFVLLTPTTVEDYPTTFSVLGLKGTKFVSEIVKDRPFEMPIGVDVFVLDSMPDNERDFRRQARSTWVWGRLLFLRGTPRPSLSLPFPLGQAASALMHLTHWGLRGLRIPPQALQQRWERAARRYEESPSGMFGDYSTRAPRQWSASSDELFPAQRVPFEDIMIMIPKDVDAVLTRGFGNYMQLPPEDERAAHKPFRVDLGEHSPENLP